MALCNYKLTFQVPSDLPLEILITGSPMRVGVAVHICLLSAFIVTLQQKLGLP